MKIKLERAKKFPTPIHQYVRLVKRYDREWFDSSTREFMHESTYDLTGFLIRYLTVHSHSPI